MTDTRVRILRGRTGPVNQTTDEPHQQKVENRRVSGASVDVDGQKNLKFEPFPVECLPEPVRSFVQAGAKSIGCDESFIAVSMLVVCAACIGNSRCIRLKHGWVEPSILWAGLIAYSGDHKSPALALSLGAIRKLQQRKLREYEAAYASWSDSQMVKYEQALAEFKKSKVPGKEAPQKAPEPIAWRVVVDDTTLEALASLLQKQERGLLLAVDELAAWLGSMERYKKGSDVAKWLEVFGGRALIIDRKTSSQKTIFIPRASVSIVGGIQPETYKRLMTKENRSNGMSARLLVWMPPRKPRKWTDASIHSDVEHAIEELIDKLLSLEMQPGAKVFDDPQPVLVDLTKDAKRLFVAFFDELALEQSAESGELSAKWSKLEAYATRFALVHYLIRWANGDIPPDQERFIDAESMQAGITLVRWFANEARRVNAMLSESPEELQGRELVDWIRQRGGETSVRDLMLHQFKYRKSADKARADLETLVKAGIGRWDSTPTDGRPAERFSLNSIDHQHQHKVEIQGENGASVDGLGGRGLGERYFTNDEIAAVTFDEDG